MAETSGTPCANQVVIVVTSPLTADVGVPAMLTIFQLAHLFIDEVYLQEPAWDTN